MSFPTTLPSYTVTTGAETPNTAAGGTGLSPLLNAFETDVTALGTKMGTGSSTPAANTILYGSGTGTSAWQSLTSAQWAAVLSDETGSGAAVFGTSPTIVTPTIASFTNAQHNHQNAAGGGQLTSAAISSLDLTNTTLKNPYKFSIYRNTAWTSAGALTLVQFDSKTYDTGTNVDVVTNKGRFTAPVAGFYHFSAHVTSNIAANGGISTGLYKNGSAAKVSAFVGGGNTAQMTNEVSGDLQLAANDYIEVYHQGSVSTGATGAANTYFDGYIISTT